MFLKEVAIVRALSPGVCRLREATVGEAAGVAAFSGGRVGQRLRAAASVGVGQVGTLRGLDASGPCPGKCQKERTPRAAFCFFLYPLKEWAALTPRMGDAHRSPWSEPRRLLARVNPADFRYLLVSNTQEDPVRGLPDRVLLAMGFMPARALPTRLGRRASERPSGAGFAT